MKDYMAQKSTAMAVDEAISGRIVEYPNYTPVSASTMQSEANALFVRAARIHNGMKVLAPGVIEGAMHLSTMNLGDQPHPFVVALAYNVMERTANAAVGVVEDYLRGVPYGQAARRCGY